MTGRNIDIEGQLSPYTVEEHGVVVMAAEAECHVHRRVPVTSTTKGNCDRGQRTERQRPP